MTPRAFFLLPILALAGLGGVRADDVMAIPLQTTSSGNPNSRTLFRNELTQVDVTDERSTGGGFDGLTKQTVTSGSGLAVSQKLGDQFFFSGRTEIGMAQDGGLSAGGAAGGVNQNLQGEAAANQAALGQTLSSNDSWNATWTPADPFSISYASSSSSELDDGRSLAEVLSSDTTFSAKWKAGSKTTLTLIDDKVQSYDWGTTGYDVYETKAVSLSQKLGPNLTWNTSPGWLQNSSGGTDPYQLTGPQLSTSFDWTPIQGTKWTVGGAWNRLAETDPWSTEATEQTTRSFFVAYDRSVSKNVRVQLRSDYSNLDAPRATAANPAQLEQFSLKAGQSYSLTDTFSANFDVSQCFQQQDHQAWATSESMATVSVQKSF